MCGHHVIPGSISMVTLSLLQKQKCGGGKMDIVTSAQQWGCKVIPLEGTPSPHMTLSALTTSLT